MTAMTCPGSPRSFLAHAMPMATDSAVLPWPEIKASCSLSFGFGKPDRPSSWRSLQTFAAAGQQLMGITLVAHVEHDLILRRRKDAVQRDRQFYGPQIGCQMAAGLRYVFQ